LLKTFVLLFINTFCGEDACVLRYIFTSIRKTQNQAEPAIKLARSERPSERRRSPCPSKGDWGAGDVRAAQAAVA